MSYKLVLSERVNKQLRKMDKRIALMLATDMKRLELLENPRSQGKALVGNHKGLWRYRIGNYRVICEIVDDELIILAINVGHRREIYKK